VLCIAARLNIKNAQQTNTLKIQSDFNVYYAFFFIFPCRKRIKNSKNKNQWRYVDGFDLSLKKEKSRLMIKSLFSFF